MKRRTFLSGLAAAFATGASCVRSLFASDKKTGLQRTGTLAGKYPVYEDSGTITGRWSPALPLYEPGRTVIIGESHARQIVDLEQEPPSWAEWWVLPLGGDAVPFVEWRHVYLLKKLLESNRRLRGEFVDKFTKPIRTRYVDYDEVARQIMSSPSGQRVLREKRDERS